MKSVFVTLLGSILFCLLLTTTVHAQIVGGRIICESKNPNDYVECDTGLMVSNPAVVQQYSAEVCTFGSTWGFVDTKIWVSHGCRAEFSYDVACDKNPVPAPRPQPAPYPQPTPAPQPAPNPYPQPAPAPRPPPYRSVDCRFNSVNWQPFYKPTAHFVGLPGYGFQDANTCVFAVQHSRHYAICNWTGQGFTSYDIETNVELDSRLYPTLQACTVAIP